MGKSIITFRDVHRLQIDVVLENLFFLEVRANQFKEVTFKASFNNASLLLDNCSDVACFKYGKFFMVCLKML